MAGTGFRTRLFCTIGLMLTAPFSSGVPTSLPQDSYTITSLGTQAAGMDDPLLINTRGAVIGTVRTSGHIFAAVWHDGAITRLPPLSGLEDSFATGINDNGQVVGYCRSKDGKEMRACIWRGQEVRPLMIMGWPNTVAMAINIHGQILLRAYADELKPAYFVWMDGKADPLPDTPAPVSLNDQGQILLSGPGAAIWQSGRVIVLGGLPGGVQSYAAAINERGWVVGKDYSPMEATPGKAYTPIPDRNFGGGMFDVPCGCLWQHGTVTALGPLPGDATSEAVGLNTLGQVVGNCGSAGEDRPSAGVTHATLWSGGRAIDLQKRVTGEKGWTLARAIGINDRGQIIGTGYFRNHNGGYDPTGFLLTPGRGNKE